MRIAVAILLGDFPQRRPRSHVVPSDVDRQHARGLGPFHDGIVDRIAGAGREGFAIEPQEIAVALAARQGVPCALDHRRLGLAQFLEITRGAEREHAAVPEIFAAGEIGLGRRQVGLLDETFDGARAAFGRSRRLDIAVAGFGRRRHDAESDQGPLLRRRQGGQHGGPEPGFVANHMIRGQDQQHRIIARGHRLQRGHGDRGRRVATHRFEQEGGRCRPDLTQLFGHDEPMFFVGHDQGRLRARQAAQAQCRLLQQRMLADQGNELLRIGLPRQGPEPRAGTAGQQDGNECAHALGNRKG